MFEEKRSISSPQKFESSPVRMGVGYRVGFQIRGSRDSTRTRAENQLVCELHWCPDSRVLGFTL